MERYNHGQKYLLGSSSITRKLGLETLLLPIDVTLSLTKHIVVRFSFSYQLSFSGTRERRNQDVLERSVRSYPAFWITAMTRTIWDSPHVAVSLIWVDDMTKQRECIIAIRYQKDKQTGMNKFRSTFIWLPCFCHIGFSSEWFWSITAQLTSALSMYH